MQQSCTFGVSRDCTDFFLGPDHVDAEFGLEKFVKRPLVLVQQLGGQPPEQIARQPDVVKHHRLPLAVQQAADFNHRFPDAHLQPPRDRRWRALALAVEQLPLQRHRAFVSHQTQEAVLDPLLGMGRHISALALAPHQQVLGSHLIDGLAHRALADAEAPRQFLLARDRIARLPLAGLQAGDDQLLDLAIQGAERRSAGSDGFLSGLHAGGRGC